MSSFSRFESLFGSQDPDPQQSGREDPDPNRSDDQDQDPHQGDSDPQHASDVRDLSWCLT
jgi:hypothetical protein